LGTPRRIRSDPPSAPGFVGPSFFPFLPGEVPPFCSANRSCLLPVQRFPCFTRKLFGFFLTPPLPFCQFFFSSPRLCFFQKIVPFDTTSLRSTPFFFGYFPLTFPVPGLPSPPFSLSAPPRGSLLTVKSNHVAKKISLGAVIARFQDHVLTRCFQVAVLIFCLRPRLLGEGVSDVFTFDPPPPRCTLLLPVHS